MEEAEKPPIEVPVDKLSEEALASLIESFILREGTDYGAVEIQHSTKIEQVRRQLVKEDVKIVFDPNSESVTILTKAEWLKLIRKFT